nr:hypothetical protein [Tanacetum cinerariifolium]
QQHLEGAAQHGQRRAQLVRGIGRKLLFAHYGLLDAVQQPVDGAGQRVQLVGPRRQGNALVQVILGDAAGRGRDGRQRRNAAPHQQPRRRLSAQILGLPAPRGARARPTPRGLRSECGGPPRSLPAGAWPARSAGWRRGRHTPAGAPRHTPPSRPAPPARPLPARSAARCGLESGGSWVRGVINLY